MKNNFVNILDFGSGKITCMAATKVSDDGEFVIKAVGQTNYNGFDDNAWYEPNTIKDAIEGAIRQVEEKTKTSINNLYVGVPGAFCAVATSEASIIYRSKTKLDQNDVNEIVKKADIYGCGADYTPLGGKPVYFIIDGAIKTADAVGTIASKLTGLVSFSYMKNYFKKTVSRALSNIGITNVTYFNACDAQAKYVAQQMRCTDHCIVIDVGHLTTTVSLCGGNALLFERSFALGSAYLGSDLMQVLGCDFPFAMQILEKVNLNLDVKNGDIYTVNGKAVDAHQANEVIKARIQQISQYIVKSFSYCDKEIPRTTPIILTGGGLTYLRGGADWLATQLCKPVRVYDSVNPQTKRNEYTSCYGLISEAIKTGTKSKGLFSFFRK